MAGADLSVIYIVGVQNSGSTLLDAILGNAPGARSLGEAGGFYRYRDGDPCECGAASASCAPCAAITGALAGRGLTDALRDLFSRVAGGRCLHWLLVPTPRRRAYAGVSDVMFDAVAQATGARTLVDSTKNVARAAALLAHSRHRVTVIHLIRDPRGYIHSRARRGEEQQRSTALVLRWAVKNALISGVLRPRARARYRLVHFEALVSAPQATLDSIGAFTGLDTAGLADRVTEAGLPRQHVFEAQRDVDYSTVRLDQRRLESQRLPLTAQRRFWRRGGWVARFWGYDRDQRYLAEAPAEPS